MKVLSQSMDVGKKKAKHEKGGNRVRKTDDKE
jgi:hypothetical protein